MENKSDKIISQNDSFISANKYQTPEIEASANPVINPLVDDIESKFYLYNSKPTNALGVKKKFKGTDIIKGEVKISIDRGYGELSIDNQDKKYSEKDFRIPWVNSTTKLFNYIITVLTEQTFGKEINPKEIKEVLINTANYQKLTGRKDYNNVGKQIEKDLEILYRCSIRYEKVTRMVKGKSIPFMKSLETRILVAKGEKTRGTFNVILVPSLVSYLIRSNQKMQLHPYYFKASPVASELLYYFGLQKRIKYKKTQNISKMKFKTVTLLNAVSSLPSYEYVIEHNTGHTRRKIIEPLKKGLDDLKEQGLIKWEYCNKKGTCLTYKQLDWKIFSNIYIQIELYI